MEPQIQHRDRTVKVNLADIVSNRLARTYLTAEEASGQTALTVKDIGGFAVGKYAWINPFGDNSEIIAMHASTAPTGSTLTLAAATAYEHAANEEIYYVEFNEIEISHADTLAGAKSVLATVGIIAREREQVYLDVSQTTGFYFARFKDSVAATFGGYSDGVAYDGWAARAAGHLIESALSQLSLTYSKQVTAYDCLHWINKGMREIKGKIRRWPEHNITNYVAGQTSRGINAFAMPADIYDTETDRSIEAVRIGDGDGLIYLDPNRFDIQQDDVKQTTVRTEASAADATLEVGNSYDFEDSGVVIVYIAGVQYGITYTGVTRSATAGVLTGVPTSGDGSITVTIPVGTNVWQDETEGLPSFYTVRNEQIEIWPLPDAQRDDQNVLLDYNTAVTEVDSEGDVIDYQRYGMLEAYLTWRIWCKAENDGKLDKQSGFYQEYKEYLNDAIRTLPPRKNKTSPNINRMLRRGNFGNKPDVTSLSVDQQ